MDKLRIFKLNLFCSIWIALIVHLLFERPVLARQGVIRRGPSSLHNSSAHNFSQLGVLYNNTTDFSKPMEFKYKVKSGEAVRIWLSSIAATKSVPILAVFREQRAILSLQVPFIIAHTSQHEDGRSVRQDYQYEQVARTLCPQKVKNTTARRNWHIGEGGPLLPGSPGNPDDAEIKVELSTVSLQPVPFQLKTFVVHPFHIRIANTSGGTQPENGTVAQQTETCVEMEVDNDACGKEVGGVVHKITGHRPSVLVRVESDDDVCMTVSIQPTGCPVFDLDNNVIFSGVHQTVTKSGAITVKSKMMDRLDFSEFFIVFVVKPVDDECTSDGKRNPPETNRTKYFTVEVQGVPSETRDYQTPMLFTVGFLICAYVVAFLYMSAISVYDNMLWEQEGRKVISEMAQAEYQLPLTENGTRSSAFVNLNDDDEENKDVAGPDTKLNPISSSDANVVADENLKKTPGTPVSCVSQSPTESGGPRSSGNNAHRLAGPQSSRARKDEIRTKVNLTVRELSDKPYKYNERKYKLYIWNLLVIALFYGLPVVQLVLTWQNMAHATGDTDVCWYNFLCARSCMKLIACNSVFSNIGYVFLGLLFLIMVKERDYRREKTIGTRFAHLKEEFGIPHHNGLLYAIGIAIMMEGVMSASYHVCPSRSNYQFDTSFMYIIGALGMLKIYQLRHPDVNANSHVAYSVIALFILLAMCGVYLGKHLWFWWIFALCYVCVMFYVSLNFYFKGAKRRESVKIRIMVYFKQNTTWQSWLVPRYRSRFVFLVLGNVVNLGFVVAGVWYQPNDFPSFLLMPFILNLFLYLMYYILMKFRCGEKLKLRAVLFLTLAFASWGGATYYFLNNVSDWSMSAAESRVRNNECILLDFYDNHDVWHFLSAISLFMSFAIFLSIDDDLQWVPRNKISVF